MTAVTATGRNHRTIIALQAVAVPFILLLAIFWPRPGDAAVLMPLNGAGPAQGFAWLGQEHASFLGFTGGDRLLVRIPSTASGIRALADGFLPISADAANCTGTQSRTIPQ